MSSDTLLSDVVSVLIFSALGIVIFAIAFLIMVRISPFSVVKEIEQDQNVALGILFGSIFVGLAIVVAAALPSF